jgi:hypothetical protein
MFMVHTFYPFKGGTFMIFTNVGRKVDPRTVITVSINIWKSYLFGYCCSCD